VRPPCSRCSGSRASSRSSAGILLALGVFTRPVAFILAGHLAFVYFIGHFPRAWFPMNNGGNLPILYCFVFFYLAFAGGGPWSVDAMRGKK
jgi:putative oxidoreductase